jgi:hypothetical protein
MRPTLRRRRSAAAIWSESIIALALGVCSRLCVLAFALLLPVLALAGQAEPFFTPAPGKSQDDFQNDRIACAYAVKPWTVRGFTDCMTARGNIVQMVASPPYVEPPGGAAVRSDIEAARAASRAGNYAEAHRLMAEAMRLSKEGAARRPLTGQPGGELFSPWGNDTAGFPGYASDLKAAVAADLAGNYAEALQFYRKIEAAAVRVNDQEDISIVRAKIAQHYEKGLGVEQSYSTAAKLMNRLLPPPGHRYGSVFFMPTDLVFRATPRKRGSCSGWRNLPQPVKVTLFCWITICCRRARRG